MPSTPVIAWQRLSLSVALSGSTSLSSKSALSSHPPVSSIDSFTQNGVRRTFSFKSVSLQVIKMLILLFLVCWGPRVSFDLIIKCCLDSYDHANYFLKLLFSLLPFVHSCLNPIVYCLMSSKFRCQLVQLVRRLFRRPCYKSRRDSLTGQSIVLRRQPYSGGGASRRTTIVSEPITSRVVTNDTCIE